MYEMLTLHHPYPELGRVHIEALIQRGVMPLMGSRVSHASLCSLFFFFFFFFFKSLGISIGPTKAVLLWKA